MYVCVHACARARLYVSMCITQVYHAYVSALRTKEDVNSDDIFKCVYTWHCLPCENIPQLSLVIVLRYLPQPHPTHHHTHTPASVSVPDQHAVSRQT